MTLKTNSRQNYRLLLQLNHKSNAYCEWFIDETWSSSQQEWSCEWLKKIHFNRIGFQSRPPSSGYEAYYIRNPKHKASHQTSLSQFVETRIISLTLRLWVRKRVKSSCYRFQMSWYFQLIAIQHIFSRTKRNLPIESMKLIYYKSEPVVSVQYSVVKSRINLKEELEQISSWNWNS